MNTYESKQKQLFKPQAEIYAMLSDLTQLEKYAAALPAEHKDKIKDLSFTPDSVSFTIDPIGQVILRIVDYETPKMLKFGADNFPIQFNFWIQLVGVADYDTRMKLTLKADIPFMLKPMIGNKLDDGIERMADMIAMIVNR
jgi:hypothetical protein